MSGLSYKCRKCGGCKCHEVFIHPKEESEDSSSLSLYWHAELRDGGRMEMEPELMTSFTAMKANNVSAIKVI